MNLKSHVYWQPLLLVFAASLVVAEDWPEWRGPNRNSTAPNQKPPTQWSETQNILWKTEVPGRGHSSPTIVGDKIFLSTAEEANETQSVICFDKQSGKKLWQTKILEGNFVSRIHGNNTHASPTIVTANEKMFVVFNNDQAVFIAALDFDGKRLWQQKTGGYIPKYPFGYGSSPCIHKDLVIVLSDYSKDGFLVAYKQDSGEEAWRTNRGFTSSFASPIVTTINGEDQLLVTGTELRSYNPNTGKENWNVALPQWQVSCGTPVWQGDTIFASGGFPNPGTYAVSASNRNIIWENRVKAYEQSLLAHNGHIYCHSENGVAYCWRASDGREMWKARATPGRVSASPVLVNDLVYMTGEKGQTTIIKANPNRFEVVAKNRLGGSAFATPAFVDDRIYTRVATSKGSENQLLYCIGNK